MIYLVIWLSLAMPTHGHEVRGTKCKVNPNPNGQTDCAWFKDHCFTLGPGAILHATCSDLHGRPLCEQYVDDCVSEGSLLSSAPARAQLRTAQRTKPARSSGSSKSAAKRKRPRNRSKTSKRRRSRKHRKRGRKRSTPKPAKKPRRRRKPRSVVIPQRCINLQQLRQETLEATNRYREKEGADPLERSPSSDAAAQGYAEELMREIESTAIVPVMKSQHGVSLSFLQVEPGDVSQVTGQDVVQRWFDESQTDDFAKTGNHSQLAWKNWKVVGHGFAADSECSQMLSVAKYNLSDE